jgi:tRNA pseudouridine13 synthase
VKASPDDFLVREELGFEPSGEGEHAFLYLEKRLLNTQELAQRLSSLAGVHPGDIGFSGMKDRQAVTRQWFSVRMAGRPEPDWTALASRGDVVLLAVSRHRRKLKRGVHRHNWFRIRLRALSGNRAGITVRLQTLVRAGAPNYFGAQRFGHDGATLDQARAWMAHGARRVSRSRRSLFYSALRAYLFNLALADRVRRGTWDRVEDGDTCLLHGTRSLFEAAEVDATLQARAASGDLHPGLPLWGRGLAETRALQHVRSVLTGERDTCDFLEAEGLKSAWRPTRLLADDFCWEFCDDGSLLLEFRLGSGAYATALLAELVE